MWIVCQHVGQAEAQLAVPDAIVNLKYCRCRRCYFGCCCCCCCCRYYIVAYGQASTTWCLLGIAVVIVTVSLQSQSFQSLTTTATLSEEYGLVLMSTLHNEEKVKDADSNNFPRSNEVGRKKRLRLGNREFGYSKNGQLFEFRMERSEARRYRMNLSN